MLKINNYSFLISQLNNAIKKKWSFVYVNYTSFNIIVLKAFYSYGIIEGFSIDTKLPHYKNCCVYLKYTKGISLISKIIPKYSAGNYFYMNRQSLKKIMKKERDSIFFLSNHYNVIRGYRYNDLKYLDLNGGLLLCIIRTL